MTARRNPFPGVSRVTDRHGKVRWRFRLKGATCYLTGVYGSADWRTAYEAAVAGAAKPARRSTAALGTVAWLIEDLLSRPEFQRLSAGRRKALRSLFDWIRAEAGDLPFDRLKVKHIEALMNKKEGPTAANSVKKALSLLFNHAIRQDFGKMTINPAQHAKRRAEQPDGWHTWTEAEIGRFLDRHGPGTMARRALMLLLCTGAARQDVARMGWQNVAAGASPTDAARRAWRPICRSCPNSRKNSGMSPRPTFYS